MTYCRNVAAIVAMDDGRLIGTHGALPWHVPEDLAHFRSLTSGQVVVMGRKTWDSLPAKFKPLPGRTNIVISRSGASLELPQGVLMAQSPEEAIALAQSVAGEKKIWIIGGAEIYRLTLPLCEEVYLTRIHGSHQGDAWLPEFERDFTLVDTTKGERCTFETYRRASL